MQNALAPEVAAGLPPSANRLLTKAQVAQLLGLSKRSIENLQGRGMPHIRLGARRCRYEADAVLTWIRDQYEVRRIGRAGGVQ